jgi:hypothetical protein
LIKENEDAIPISSRKIQVMKMPADINCFDKKIKEIVSLIG